MKQTEIIRCGGFVSNAGTESDIAYHEEVSPTLRATVSACVVTEKSPPKTAAGFKPEQSATAQGIGYQVECAPTLKAGGSPPAVVIYEKLEKI